MKNRKPLFFVVSLFIFVFGVCGMEITPRYIVLSTPPPDHYKGGLAGSWHTKVKSVLISPPSITPDLRIFIYRKETIVVHDATDKYNSWDSIIDYFDNEFEYLGWERSDTYAPCDIYLPEANFLPENTNNGYVYYRRKDYKPNLNIDESDVICLAVWQPTPESFNIVLITARPSYFTILFHLLF